MYNKIYDAHIREHTHAQLHSYVFCFVVVFLSDCGCSWDTKWIEILSTLSQNSISILWIFSSTDKKNVIFIIIVVFVLVHTINLFKIVRNTHIIFSLLRLATSMIHLTYFYHLFNFVVYWICVIKKNSLNIPKLTELFPQKSVCTCFHQSKSFSSTFFLFCRVKTIA